MNRGNGSDPEYEFYRKYHLPLRESINFLFPVALRLIGGISPRSMTMLALSAAQL